MDEPEIQDALLRHASWADMDDVHARLAWLRANDPVRRAETASYPPFWHVTRHDDVFAVERTPDAFAV